MFQKTKPRSFGIAFSLKRDNRKQWSTEDRLSEPKCLQRHEVNGGPGKRAAGGALDKTQLRPGRLRSLARRRGQGDETLCLIGKRPQENVAPA